MNKKKIGKQMPLKELNEAPPVKQPNKLITLIEAMTAHYGIGLDQGDRKRPHKLKKCLQCGQEHRHNNAFCSAEHCKQWRDEHKKVGLNK